MASLSALDKEQYKAKSNAEKDEQRMEWLRLQTEKYLVSTEFEKSWSRVDYANGTYRSLNAIASLEGGKAEDVAAALKHAAKCIKMQYPWVKYNEMTERWDYLWFMHGVNEEMSKHWRVFQRSEVMGGPGPSSSSTPTPGDAAGKEAIAQPSGCNGPKPTVVKPTPAVVKPTPAPEPKKPKEGDVKKAKVGEPEQSKGQPSQPSGKRGKITGKKKSPSTPNSHQDGNPQPALKTKEGRCSFG